ncbi:hypothetical protein BG000_006442 [Podila horticola]|nr:hypothetical protein BG000_006442 [Podila horticola]
MISPSSPRSPGHERCDQTGSVSSKTSSSKWGMSAKFAFINLKKKRSMLPSHYLSLPVGGSTSSANGLYMLHSEDLSVTEFAKLAGITILSEDDTNTRAQEERANGGEGDGQGQGQGQAGPGPGSVFDSGDTINSDRHLTFNSMASDSSFHLLDDAVSRWQHRDAHSSYFGINNITPNPNSTVDTSDKRET